MIVKYTEEEKATKYLLRSISDLDEGLLHLLVVDSQPYKHAVLFIKDKYTPTYMASYISSIYRDCGYPSLVPSLMEGITYYTRGLESKDWRLYGVVNLQELATVIQNEELR